MNKIRDWPQFIHLLFYIFLVFSVSFMASYTIFFSIGFGEIGELEIMGHEPTYCNILNKNIGCDFFSFIYFLIMMLIVSLLVFCYPNYKNERRTSKQRSRDGK